MTSGHNSEDIKLKGNEELLDIQISKLVANPNQPRKTFNEETLEELAKSIKSSRQIVPIIVSPLKDGKYLIVDGERRLRACKKYLKMNTIPALVKPMSQEQIELNTLIVNIHREDIPKTEKEDYVKKLYDRFGQNALKTSRKIGWKDSHTVQKYVDAWHDRQELFRTRVQKRVIDDASMTVLDCTKTITNPEKRARFIQKIQDSASLPWELRRNKEALLKAVKIFNDSKPEIQEKILLDDLTFDDAKRLLDSITKVENELARQLSAQETHDTLDLYEDQKDNEDEIKKSDDKQLRATMRGEEQSGPSERTEQIEKMYGLTDKFKDWSKALNKMLIVHELHFKSNYDDTDVYTEMQKMAMEVFKHVGSEEGYTEEKRIRVLQDIADRYETVHKITGMILPLVLNEIKNSKVIDVESLR